MPLCWNTYTYSLIIKQLPPAPTQKKTTQTTKKKPHHKKNPNTQNKQIPPPQPHKKTHLTSKVQQKSSIFCLFLQTSKNPQNKPHQTTSVQRITSFFRKNNSLKLLFSFIRKKKVSTTLLLMRTGHYLTLFSLTLELMQID